jgi:glycosyltransferase involved in cell wall biosynthesis
VFLGKVNESLRDIVMKKIKYIGFYDRKENEAEKRIFSPAATSKMDYIAESLVENGYEVEIVSFSATGLPGYFPGKKVAIHKHISYRLMPTYLGKNFFEKVFSMIFFRFQIFKYLLLNINKNETVLVYHTLEAMLPLLILKFFRKFSLVLEVEEIYQNAVSISWLRRKLEFALFKKASSYIFPTEMLSDKINKDKKPYSIICGTYRVEHDRDVSFKDGRIHCIYAGTLDSHKGGCQAAVASAEFLDEKYHLHILGFGSKEEKKDLLNLIDTISNKTRCKVTYDGLLSGEEYIQFIQRCQIGLSAQNPNAEFNDTSFPSKVLSYMANGLRVVSVRIKVLEHSPVNNLLFYCEKNDPEQIAKAIRQIDMNDNYEGRETIKMLDEKFVSQIKNVLEV